MFNKQTQRCLSFLLALVMVFSLIPVSALALETEDLAATPADSTETSESTSTGTEEVTPTETETVIPNESSEPGSTEETDETPTKASDPEESISPKEIQARIDAVLDSLGITDDMTDDEIANSIIAADGVTMQYAMVEIEALDREAENLTDEQLQTMNVQTYCRFLVILRKMQTPMLLATSANLFNGNLTISSSAAKGGTGDASSTVSGSGDTATITATMVCGKYDILGDTTTATITLTNNLSNKAELSFSWSASDYSSLSLGDGGATGSITYTLEGNASTSFTITRSASRNETKTATIALSNISLKEFVPSNVTVTYDSTLGSVTVDGTAATADSVHEVEAEGSIALAATANSGATFMGWINTADNKLLSSDASFTYNPTGNATVKAVFRDNASTTPWFMVNNSYLFSDLNTAAGMTGAVTVVLMNNGTLPAGDYTIPAGVTLLIPFDDANTLYTTEPEIQRLDSTSTTNENVYRTLTMATGANITVNGAISVSAKQIGAHSPYYNSGAPYGDYGHIAMQGTSSITLESGAALYAWGFITGSGSVVAKNGATVYEGFVFQDWRGGDATSTMEDVLPLCQYYVQNIQVPLTLYYGATEKVRMTVHIAVGMQSCTLNFIAPSDGIFNLTSGYVTKRYDNSTDRLIMEAYGDMTVSPTTITMGSEILGGATINTKDFAFPITNNLTMVINSGTMTVNQDIALLPGSEVYIRANGNIVLGTGINVYVYDSDQWGGYCGTYGAKFIPLTYVPGRTYNRTNADLKDVIVQVDGTFDASKGYLYTTASGANICSTGNGEVITTAGTATVTYQNSCNSDTNTEIPITPAKLKNADGTYTETTGASNTTYEYYNGKWCSHTTWTDANCTTAKTCSGCGKTEGTPLGHSASTDWTSDATSHWHTCENGCDEKLDKADHTDGDPVLENPDTNAGTCESVVYCTSCEAELSRDTISLVQLAAINASADAEVILMLKFVIPDAVLSDAKATVTVYFREESYSYAVSSLEEDERGRYVVSQNIASGEMTCPVTVQFNISNGFAGIYDYASQKCDTSVSRTVKDYAERVLNSSAASEGQKEIVTALVTYGGYSQIVFGVNTDDLAYDVLGSTPSLNVESITDAVSRSGSIGITQTTQEAHLDSAIWLRVYFKLDDGKSIDDYSFKLTYPINGVTATMTVIPSYDSANSRYYVDIKDIPAAYLDNPYTFTITSSEGTYTVTTSVVAYLASLLSSSEATAAQKNAAKAMYLYSQAASEFFNK